MKRTYIKPAVEILDIETKATFMVVSYNVRDEKGEIYDPSTDHGYIIEDKDLKEGEYDPWNSTKW
mgnify:CR=1 FL=1